MENFELLTVAASQHDADFLKLILDAVGIDNVFKPIALDFGGDFSATPGEVEVYVATKDFERAKKLIEDSVIEN